MAECPRKNQDIPVTEEVHDSETQVWKKILDENSEALTTLQKGGISLDWCSSKWAPRDESNPVS